MLVKDYRSGQVFELKMEAIETYYDEVVLDDWPVRSELYDRLPPGFAIQAVRLLEHEWWKDDSDRFSLQIEPMEFEWESFQVISLEPEELAWFEQADK